MKTADAMSAHHDPP